MKNQGYKRITNYSKVKYKETKNNLDGWKGKKRERVCE